MTTRLFERYEAIIRAYTAALDGRDPTTVDILDLLPLIDAAVPDATPAEIAAALRWIQGHSVPVSARQTFREADRLEVERRNA